MVLLIFMIGCTNSQPAPPSGQSPEGCDIVLILPTADGLHAGSSILFKDKKVGRIVRVFPVVNQVEGCAQFEKEFRPSQSARFELVRGEEGDRFIRVVDETPSSPKLAAGEKISVRLPPETLEDRLWISR